MNSKAISNLRLRNLFKIETIEEETMKEKVGIIDDMIEEMTDEMIEEVIDEMI